MSHGGVDQSAVFLIDLLLGHNGYVGGNLVEGLSGVMQGLYFASVPSLQCRVWAAMG